MCCRQGDDRWLSLFDATASNKSCQNGLEVTVLDGKATDYTRVVVGERALSEERFQIRVAGVPSQKIRGR